MRKSIPKELTPKQLVEKLKREHISFSDNKDTKSYNYREIQAIGFFKLKEFAYTYSNWNKEPIRKLLNNKLNNNEYKKLRHLLTKNKLYYSNLTFNELINRYNQDKNVRMNVLGLIESLEVSLDSNVADILGRYGAFGYLNFFNWANHNLPKSRTFIKEERINKNIFPHRYKIVNNKEYKRYSREKIMKEQEHLKYSITKSLPKHIRMANFLRCFKSNDMYYCKDYYKGYLSGWYPPVWLMVNTINFGEIQHIMSLMQINDLSPLSKRYRCSYKELISWVGCLHNIRNICAHNEDFVDISLKRNPINVSWFNCFITKRNHHYVLATPLFILKYLLFSIPHDNHNFNNIICSLKKMIHNSTSAQLFGFKNRYSINILSESKNRIMKFYASLK